MQFKNNWSEISGLDQNICYNNARSNSELLTFLTLTFDLDLETYFRNFLIQALSFECLKLTTLLSVCENILRISVTFEFQGYGVNLKVMVVKQRQQAGLCFPRPRTQFKCMNVSLARGSALFQIFWIFSTMLCKEACSMLWN